MSGTAACHACWHHTASATPAACIGQHAIMLQEQQGLIQAVFQRGAGCWHTHTHTQSQEPLQPDICARQGHLCSTTRAWEATAGGLSAACLTRAWIRAVHNTAAVAGSAGDSAMDAVANSPRPGDEEVLPCASLSKPCTCNVACQLLSFRCFFSQVAGSMHSADMPSCSAARATHM